MPLIACPECNASVFSQADACVKCGSPLDFQSCPTCEHVTTGDRAVCPACGHPLAAEASTEARAFETHSPLGWYKAVWGRFAEFSGRARRKEYWWFTVFNMIVALSLALLDGMIGTFSAEAGLGLFSGLYILVAIIPSLAVAVRRLHDTGRTGWWILIGLIPLIGGVVLFIFTVLDSEPEANAYGAPPKPFTGSRS